MKKIILCGATHGSNFGDSLFAYMFKQIIEHNRKDLEVLFTKVSDYSNEYLSIKEASIKDILKSEGFIYISGGYFGQSHKEDFRKSVLRFLTYFKYGLLMILFHRPVAIIGVGAGPLDRIFLKKIAVFLFNKSKVVTVRDETSRSYMHDYGVKRDILVTSDSAQVIDNKLYSLQLPYPDILKDAKVVNRKKVLVHIIDSSEDNNKRYMNTVIKAIKETLLNTTNCGFIITSDTNKRSDFIKEVYSAFPKDRSLIYNFNDPIGFLSIINNVDSIITPKLHVGILGCTYNKPVLAFPIHPGKTKRYYEQIGYPEHCMSLYDTTNDIAVEMILKYVWEPINLPKHIKTEAQMNFDLLKKFLLEHIK